mmetsp:Transcript_2183/g.6535  ORF Transcript_2183/g.6535 Transcript_2183/m.6535 type:complete len:294 (-) Transcript_2183:66-947(-)
MGRLHRLVIRSLGRIEDLSLVLAGAMQGLGDPSTAGRRQQRLFTCYRYLNAVHYLTYYGVDLRMGGTPVVVLGDLVRAGLVTGREADALLMTPNKMRQVILSWISCMWNEMLKEGAVRDSWTAPFITKLTSLRGDSVLHIEQAPNLIKVMLKLVVSLLVLFVTVAYPWKIRLAEPERCFQPFGLLSTFLLSFCYVGLLAMMGTLEKSPFIASGDCINIDYILCEVELMTFRTIRASFSRTHAASMAALLNPKREEELMQDIPYESVEDTLNGQPTTPAARTVPSFSSSGLEKI